MVILAPALSGTSLDISFFSATSRCVRCRFAVEFFRLRVPSRLACTARSSSECSAGARSPPRAEELMSWNRRDHLAAAGALGLRRRARTPRRRRRTRRLQYAIPDADVVGALRRASVVPGNYKMLTALPDQPADQGVARAREDRAAGDHRDRGPARHGEGDDRHRSGHRHHRRDRVRPGRAERTTRTSCDAAHGKFSAATIDKIGEADAQGRRSRSAPAAWVDPGDGTAVAVTKDGVLLAGHAGAREGADGRHAGRRRRTAPARTSATRPTCSAQKPVFAVVLTMSQTARTEALKNMLEGGRTS